MAPTGVANAASTPYRWAIHLFSTAMARSTQRSIGHDAFPSGERERIIGALPKCGWQASPIWSTQGPC